MILNEPASASTLVGFTIRIVVATTCDTLGHAKQKLQELSMSKMGRPELPDELRKDAELRIRMTREERELLDAAADGKTSTWAREVLVRAAKRKA